MADQSSLNTDLEAYWTMNETSGTRYDSTTNDLDLSDNNTVGSAAGKIDNASDFDDANDEYLSHADDTKLRGGDRDYTIAFWAKLHDKGTVYSLVSKGNLTDKFEFEVYYTPGFDRFIFLIETSSGIQKVQADALGSPSANEWYHIAVRHDAANDSIDIIINGSLVDTENYSGTPVTPTTYNDFVVGAALDFGGGISYDTDGEIDEMGFWSRYLTNNEIARLYNDDRGLTFADFDEVDNVQYPTCPCEECGELEATDLASNSTNTGTPSGKSVLLSSGKFSFNLPLLSIPSLGGLQWGFSLSYLQGNNVDDILGINFNYPQNLLLVELSTGDVLLKSGGNTQETFVETSPGVYEPASENNTRAVLTRAGTGANDVFTLTASDGTVTKFYGFDVAINTPGRLKSVADRYGSQQTYTWTLTSGKVQLTEVTDSYDRKAEYRYYGSEHGYRLKEIEDFLERKLNFQYDSDGRLVAVITPSIDRAAEGNTFPGGTAYVFQYDTTNPETDRQNDLIRIWYPNEVAPFLDEANRSVDVNEIYALQDAVGHWRMNHGSGTTVTDSSPTGKNGTMSGGVDWSVIVPPRVTEPGFSLDFDGDDGLVNLGTIGLGTPLMLNDSPATIACWFRQRSGGDTSQRIVAKSDGASAANGYELAASTTDRQILLMVDGNIYRTANNVYEFDTWTHVAAVITATEFRVYINGVQVSGSFDGGDSAQLPPNVVTNMRIGSWNHTTGREFDGKLSDLRIYDVELSDATIERLYELTYPEPSTPTPRYKVEYGQDSSDLDTYGRVLKETVGDPDSTIGGTYEYDYETTGLPANLIDPGDIVTFQCTMTDRNGNETVYDFNANQMAVKVDVKRNRDKIDVPSATDFPSYATYTKYNAHNLPVLKVLPEGNSIEYAYEDGEVSGIMGTYNRRVGLLRRETRKVDNPLKLDATNAIDARRDAPSNGQIELTWTYFYDPVFNSQTATVEERGNPIAADFQIWGASADLSGKCPNGSFFENGTQNSQPAYEHADGTFWLWWDGASEWHISVAKGSDGSGHWKMSGSSSEPRGSYTAVSSATGSLEVSAADYFVTGDGFDASDETSPAGQYYQDGTQGGQPAYRLANGNWWLWYTGSEWHISKTKGTDGTAYFDNNSGTITVVPYAAAGTNGGGSLTVTANGGMAFFAPQNDGTTPSLTDRDRYLSRTYRDYQKNVLDIAFKDDIKDLLGLPAAGDVDDLIQHVTDQLTAIGYSAGFEMDLGDINGDGTGDGNSSGLPEATLLGNTVKAIHPDVRLIGSTAITTQTREEIFTTNDRGQQTTHTDAEGNLTVWVRFAFSDPEGDGRFVAADKGGKQYGRIREIHRDADPDDVLSLVGSDGDLVDFIPGKITRTNMPGVYQDLVTRYEGTTIGAGGGCASCAYDALGNALAETDARGFTTHFDRNELGEVYRVTGPDPYRYRVETYYDANRNVTRVDTEDKWVQYDSDAPSDADYAHFTLDGSGSYGQVPVRAGVGGSIRPGWFTDLTTYDLLDNPKEQNRDATGSSVENPETAETDRDRLITTFEYDPNENLIKTTKPEGNTVEIDYDERNLQIAAWIGGDGAVFTTGAISITAYGGNGNVIQAIGPTDDRGAAGNHATAVMEDAFDTGAQLSHTGDFAASNSLDGFDRVVFVRDAVGNVSEMKFDPGGRAIQTVAYGPTSGATPTDRKGTNNKRLTDGTMRFDEAGRQYESQQDVFAASGTTLPSAGRTVDHTGGGLATNSVADNHTGTVEIIDNTGNATSNESYVLTRTIFDKSGRAVEVLADNTAGTTTVYDGANRAIRQTDAAGNEVVNTFDANGNVIFVRRSERPTFTEPVADVEVFETAMKYDSLGRLVATAVANPVGPSS